MATELLRVLVLDDSDEFRDFFVELLNQAAPIAARQRDAVEVMEARIQAEGFASVEQVKERLRTLEAQNDPVFCAFVDQRWDANHDDDFGFRAARALRGLRPDLPVVIYSNHLDRSEAFKRMAFAAGAVRYFTKPLLPADVASLSQELLSGLIELARLRRFLEDRQREQQKAPFLALALEGGQAIIDREEIVWFVSEGYERLLGVKSGAWV